VSSLLHTIPSTTSQHNNSTSLAPCPPSAADHQMSATEQLSSHEQHQKTDGSKVEKAVSPLPFPSLPFSVDGADVQTQPQEQANKAVDAPVVLADTGEFNLKSVRKQDGPAHATPGGHVENSADHAPPEKKEEVNGLRID
jgi:hypothetical protein